MRVNLRCFGIHKVLNDASPASMPLSCLSREIASFDSNESRRSKSITDESCLWPLLTWSSARRCLLRPWTAGIFCDGTLADLLPAFLLPFLFTSVSVTSLISCSIWIPSSWFSIRYQGKRYLVHAATGNF